MNRHGIESFDNSLHVVRNIKEQTAKIILDIFNSEQLKMWMTDVFRLIASNISLEH